MYSLKGIHTHFTSANNNITFVNYFKLILIVAIYKLLLQPMKQMMYNYSSHFRTLLGGGGILIIAIYIYTSVEKHRSKQNATQHSFDDLTFNIAPRLSICNTDFQT